MASNVHRGTVPAVIKGHRHFSYGGATLPESVTIQQYYDISPAKKSDVRINDELIPKPTHINLGEKRIKVSIPREHPYQSHISCCALFPTYHSPDDPHTGIRATTKLPLNPLLPASAPQVTLLNKSKGSPYRHEILDVSMATKRNVKTWPGQNGFQNHTKPVQGDTQVFYPKVPKTLCPNVTLRDWHTTLSERTANTLSNLEKSQWLTSYQLHYTGTGPANPIQLDDFHEKTIKLITGEINPYSAQLRERSYPIFLPPRPLEGRKARILQNRNPLESPFPSHPEPPGWSLSSKRSLGAQETTSGKIQHSQDNISNNVYQIPHKQDHDVEVFKGSQANELSQPRHSSEFNSMAHVCEVCWERNCACRVRPSDSGSTGAQTIIKKIAGMGNKTENIKPESSHSEYAFQPPLQDKNRGQRDLSNSKAQSYIAKKNPFELSLTPFSSVECKDKLVGVEQQVKELEKKMVGAEAFSHTVSGTQPGSYSTPFRSGGRTRAPEDGLFRPQSALLELQDSFSQTASHQRFHESLQGASVDLRDNHQTGRKHSFYGFNSFYFHN